jgi:hypothetical protein
LIFAFLITFLLIETATGTVAPDSTSEHRSAVQH